MRMSGDAILLSAVLAGPWGSSACFLASRIPPFRERRSPETCILHTRSSQTEGDVVSLSTGGGHTSHARRVLLP